MMYREDAGENGVWREWWCLERMERRKIEREVLSWERVNKSQERIQKRSWEEVEEEVGRSRDNVERRKEESGVGIERSQEGVKGKTELHVRLCYLGKVMLR
ncbi:hypothetical protein Pmani_012181 [Petrolisthes manimaculis]|uniref:Uncharacterized protein n=1 Tax=Petrolisthes manimaculis TaxID=1843537 RepID=A0AAE1Q113_9EUCA|nr:hypothetical protein Pmani_012181 [Petrolisthes manimaculis]